jgi:hypothetical protein
MNQVLHIFKKDVRHLYPEILIALILTIALALIAPFEAVRGDAVIAILSALIHFLLPIAWLVLIARLIQDECLVGDNQFWITRPYTRPALLGAKLLFLLAFIYLPLFLVQCYLLVHAGLNPIAALPDLLLSLLALTALFFLPLTVLAAITSSFPRYLLALLAASVYVTALFSLGAYLFGKRMETPHMDGVAPVLFLALPAAALILQYTRRSTRLATGLLIAAPALLFLVYLLPAGTVINQAYPTWAQPSAPKLVFDPDPTRQQPTFGNSANNAYSFNGRVFLTLPVKLEGLPADSHVVSKGITFTIDTPEGFHWASPWYKAGGEFTTEHNQPSLQVELPVAVYDRIRDTPVNLHLSLAVLQVQPEAIQTVTATDQRFEVPGYGVCSIGDSEQLFPTCNFALRDPAPTLVTANLYPNRCGPDVAPLGQGKIWMGQLYDRGHSPSLNPVVTLPLRPLIPSEDRSHLTSNTMCPGEPIAFTPNRVVGRAQLHLDQSAILLTPYVTASKFRSHVVFRTQPGPTTPGPATP